MYCYCHCPNNQPTPFHYPSAAPTYENNQQQLALESPPNNHPPSHNFGAGCAGMWVYICFQHLNPYGLTPPLDHADQCMEGCCYRSLPPQHVSDDSAEKISEKDLDNKPTVRVYCKARTDYSLTIRHRKVILAFTHPSDPHQHWVKDEKFGYNVKDEQGYPSFALVNKATGEALKHSIGVNYPVQLTKYNSNKLDKTVLWTMGRNLGDGYRAVRAVDNIHLNVAAPENKWTKIPDDLQEIVFCDWGNSANLRWTIVSYCKFF